MKFLVSSLPTKGVTIPNGLLTEFEINPLTYKQLVEYTNHDYENDIDETIAEIEHFIMDIKNWELISAYDLSSILFTRKYISATFSDSIIVHDKKSNKDYKVFLDQITFKELNDELLNIKTVELSGQTFLFKIPTIKEYYDALRMVSSNFSASNLWMNKYDCMILAALGIENFNKLDIIDAYSRASGDDVVTIKYIDNLLNNTVNDVTIKEENGGDKVVNISRYTADIFRFILQNRLLDRTKITLKQKVQSNDE